MCTLPAFPPQCQNYQPDFFRKNGHSELIGEAQEENAEKSEEYTNKVGREDQQQYF